MVTLREILTRFRPVAVPGAPTGGAVPADREAERDAELAPVFASLDEAEAEARGIRDGAAGEAAAIRAAGALRAEAIIQEALSRAPQERDRVARRVRLEADEYCAATLERAQERSASMRARARPLARAFAADLVARVAAELRMREPGADR